MTTSSGKIPRALWLVATALVALALVVSVALLVDYLKPAPVFCGVEGGCGRVKLSEYASFHGVPTPAFGLAGMIMLAIFLVIDRPRLRSLFAVTAAGGAMVAMNLIFQQWKMHAFCVYCMTFDSSMIALALVGLARLPSATSSTSAVESEGAAKGARWSPRARASAAALFLLVAIVPAVVGHFLKARVPPAIAAEIVHTAEDKWTLIDFVDYQCPYCRFTNAALEPLLAKEAGHYRIVRKQVPLTRVHPHASGAARAAVCADQQSLEKGDQMAHLLFETDEDLLDDAHYKQMASTVGLDVNAFIRCTNDPVTQAKIDDDIKTFVGLGGHGLPLLYIGRTRLEGMQDEASLSAAIKRADDELLNR